MITMPATPEKIIQNLDGTDPLINIVMTWDFHVPVQQVFLYKLIQSLFHHLPPTSGAIP